MTQATMGQAPKVDRPERRESPPAVPPVSSGNGAPPTKGMAAAVAADLETLDLAKIPGGHTNAALARWLAQEIDGCDAGPTVAAKLAGELNKAMAALTKRGGGDGDDGFEDFSDAIQTPVIER